MASVARIRLASASGIESGVKDALLDAWPSRDDLQAILNTPMESHGVFHGVVCIPYAQFKAQHLPDPQELLRLPPPDAHPIMVARKLLILASLLQNLAPAAARQLASRLSADRQTIMSRAVETVARHVNSDDDLASTIEGVECIMMESMYHNNAGHLRRAYTTMRRAFVIAQMIGVDNAGRSTSVRMVDFTSRDRLSPEHTWFRIVQSDRYLSLMLGLPPGSTSDAFAAPRVLRTCTPLELLERKLTMVGGLIMRQGLSAPHSMDETLKIDKILLDAAAVMPPRWWLPVDPARAARDGVDAMDATLGATTQLAYYHVLGRLHLPYLLHRSDDYRCEYSKMTAITASRELLVRFIAFRGDTQDAGTYCRGIDFLAFIASTALCIGHIHGCAESKAAGQDAGCGGRANVLAHQRLPDRGILERVLEIMEQTTDADTEDAIAAKVAAFLRQLLAVEGEVARGDRYSADTAEGVEGGELECHGTTSRDGSGLLISLPHLGTIRIERRESRGKEPASPSAGIQPDAIWTVLAGPELDAAAALNEFEFNSEGDWDLQGVDVALFDSICWWTSDNHVA